VYTEPVYYALAGQGSGAGRCDQPGARQGAEGPQDAKDCLRLAELSGCGLLRGSYIPAQDLKDLRDLTRYRTKTVQARTSEIQRLAKALESAGIKLDSVVSDLTGKSATLMIEGLTGGERRGRVLADLAIGRMRTAGKLADLSRALTGRFTDHHAVLCRLHRDRIALFSAAVGGLEARIAVKAAPYRRELELLKSIDGFGDAVALAPGLSPRATHENPLVMRRSACPFCARSSGRTRSVAVTRGQGSSSPVSMAALHTGGRRSLIRMRPFSQADRFPPGSFGEDYPLSAVDEFTCRIEVTGVACRLSDHMQEDLAQVVEPPAAEQVLRPPRRCAV